MRARATYRERERERETERERERKPGEKWAGAHPPPRGGPSNGDIVLLGKLCCSLLRIANVWALSGPCLSYNIIGKMLAQPAKRWDQDFGGLD